MTKLLNVPHIQQTEKASCGAAALAMVYQFLRFKDTQNEIWGRLKEPRKIAKGYMITVNKMTEDAGNKNLNWFRGDVIWQDKRLAFDPIEQFLQFGIPLMVCQRVERRSKLGHFRVVIGLDTKWVYVNDPLKAKSSVMSRNKFLALWQKASDEVTGGLFLAIFKKGTKINFDGFKLFNFRASIKSFVLKSVDWN